MFSKISWLNLSRPAAFACWVWDMRIERFDPVTDADTLAACYQLLAAASPVDDDPEGPRWSLQLFTGSWTCGWAGTPRETWLARDHGGDLVGCYLLELPDRENLTEADVFPLVALDRRRSGIGTALLRHAAARAASAGRARLWGEARSGSPGSAFAKARGAQPGLIEVRRVLHLADLSAATLTGLSERARQSAAGYSLVPWEGPTPDAYLSQVAAIHAAMADAPLNPGVQPQHFDEARIRAMDHRLITVQGMRYYSLAARCDATGELAGLTQLGVEPEQPAWGVQLNTAVTRAHRGRRLGMLLKAGMLELLAVREPQLQAIVTANSASNERMIGINAELGFRVLDTWQRWELGVPEAARAAADLAVAAEAARLPSSIASLT
jgi:GNAT superfamily N-acetyltransferase/RimJ/RimL family protein N-acetyltransferase